MYDDIRKIWDQLVKYAMISNATALAFSLAAVSKSPLISSGISVPRFSIWCFAFGLVSSALHLAYSFVFKASNVLSDLQDKISDMEKKLEKINSDRKERIISSDYVDIKNDIENRKRLLAEVSDGFDGSVMPMLRGMQEFFLIASYALFAIGLFYGLWQLP